MKKILHHRDPENLRNAYDRCIRSSPYGTIYSLSWYLDVVCPDWELLALEDRSAFMPLPVYSSLRRKSIRQPGFTFQLGIYSTRIPESRLIDRFLNAIPRDYRVRQCCLNKYNIIQSDKIRIYNAAELDLIRPYERIAAGYSYRIKAALSQAKTQQLSIMDQTSVHDYLSFASRFDARKRSRLKPNEVSLLRMLTSKAQQKRHTRIYAAYDERNEMCAAIMFLNFNGRTNLLHAASSTNGIDAAALPFLLDAYVKRNAEKNLVFSCEHSSDKELMDLYLGMGAAMSEYPCLKRI